MPDGSAVLVDPPMPLGGEEFGAWFDAQAADRAVAFFHDHLCHTEGEWMGMPFRLSDVQRDRIIRPLFGWKRADGTRLIRTLFLEVPRKFGKTELAAGVSLIALLADGEFGGQVYSSATDEDQARIVFDKATVMVGMSDSLMQELEAFKKSIYCPSLLANFKPLSSKPRGKHGFSPTGNIADEIHEWPTGELYQVILDGQGSRRQPINFLITTAGIKGIGFGWEMHERAIKVRDGIIIDPTFLPVIFAADPDDDWTDEAVWAKANPHLGVTPKLEFLRSQCRDAQESARLENNFRRFHLNQWTEQVERWLPMDKWDACPSRHLSLADLSGRRGWGGLDLSSTTDLTALVIAFEADTPECDWDLWTHFWLPSEGLKQRVKRDQVPYDQWAADGWITLTEGNVVDYDVIRGMVTGAGEAPSDDPAVIDMIDLAELAYDRWNADHIATQLMGDGVEMVKFGQGFASMSAPSKELEKLVLGRRLNWGSSPVMRWMASCAEIKSDPAGNIKPVKPDRKKSTNRIDGIVATVMSLGRATVHQDTGGSYLDDGAELLVL